LQLFATNLKHLKHVERLIKGFNLQQPLAKFVCLPPPKFISAHELSCKAEINQPIVCNEQRWKVIADKVNSRHIGLMLSVGGANVHLGMLYFDLQDTVDIFSHEVSHLLGFVDEYPLVKNHEKCQEAQQKMFSHNIAVLNTYYDGEQRAVREKVLSATPWARYIKRSTPILQPVINGLTKKTLWQVGTPNKYKGEVGLYEAESCQNSSKLTGGYSNTRFSAFKPLNQRTQLRNHSSKFPPQYLDLLKSKPQTYLMPSFHYNIALALYQKGDIEQAKYWLTEATKWESTPLRKRLIGKGEF
jgi:hypothetical protein